MTVQLLSLLLCVLVATPAWAGRSLVASDDFNTGAGPSLGSNWANLNSLTNDMEKTATTAYGKFADVIGNEGAARWVGAGSFADNQYSSVKISSLSFLSASYYIGVICRASADTDGSRDYYYATVHSDAGGPNYTTKLGKIVNGTHTNLHSASASWAVNDRVEIECDGTTIRVMKNGAALGGSFTQTDSSLASGKPGILGAGGNGVIGDDWEGGDVTLSPISNFAHRRRSR